MNAAKLIQGKPMLVAQVLLVFRSSDPLRPRLTVVKASDGKLHAISGVTHAIAPKWREFVLLEYVQEAGVEPVWKIVADYQAIVLEQQAAAWAQLKRFCEKFNLPAPGPRNFKGGEHHAPVTTPGAAVRDGRAEVGAWQKRAENAESRLKELRESLEESNLGKAVNYWMGRATDAEQSLEHSEDCQVISVPNNMIPKGTRLVECYETERNYIILGQPSDCEDENSPEYHNCDAMGCGTLSHVVKIVPKGIYSGASRKDAETQKEAR